MTYRLEYAAAARKAIRAIRDRALKRRIEAALLRLREDPRPAGAKRLVGQEGTLRIRVGDWRIVYEVHEREVAVLVVRIGPRGEVGASTAPTYLLRGLEAALIPTHLRRVDKGRAVASDPLLSYRQSERVSV